MVDKRQKKIPGHRGQRAGQGRENLLHPIFPGGTVRLVVVGTVAGILAFPGTPEMWPTLLSFGFLLGVVVAFVGGLIYNAKKVVPAANLGKIDVLFSLENEEQKQVRRQIAGKAPIDPEHLAVTRAAAVQLRKGLATQLLLQPLMPCVFAAQAMNFALGGDNLVAVLNDNCGRRTRDSGWVSHP